MSQTQTVEHAPKGLVGELTIPANKSITHRCFLFSALCCSPMRVTNPLMSGDTQASLRAVQQLGVRVEREADSIILHPRPSLMEPEDVIDCGNSGTTVRLLLGLLGHLDGTALMTGDSSLRSRPMKRVTGPLAQMGMRFMGRQDAQRLPLAATGFSSAPKPWVFHQPVASAQVKTALLLAGLRTGMTIVEPGLSRDHTERMFRQMGATVTTVEQDGSVTHTLAPCDQLHGMDMRVPGDPSSAVFWLVAGSVVPGSKLVLKDVGLNPSRSGMLDVLRKMGADIDLQLLTEHPEPVYDVTVTHSQLVGCVIEKSLTLRSIDEIPALAIAAACCRGQTVIRDAAELRVKESDRLTKTVELLRLLGVEVVEEPDGMTIYGTEQFAPGPHVFDAMQDHRLAMSAAIAGCLVTGGIQILQAESVQTSYPSFFGDLASLNNEQPARRR